MDKLEAGRGPIDYGWQQLLRQADSMQKFMADPHMAMLLKSVFYAGAGAVAGLVDAALLNHQPLHSVKELTELVRLEMKAYTLETMGNLEGMMRRHSEPVPPTEVKL